MCVSLFSVVIASVCSLVSLLPLVYSVVQITAPLDKRRRQFHGKIRKVKGTGREGEGNEI